VSAGTIIILLILVAFIYLAVTGRLGNIASALTSLKAK
jgi:hypothetical protein